MFGNSWKVAFAAAMLAGAASAVDLDPKDQKSVKHAAKAASSDAISYYNNRPGEVPGALPDKWWEGGVLFDTLIQYWFYTGDASNNAAVTKGLYWQSGDKHDFSPSNYSAYLGNDDQLVWGLASMTAAELSFPEDNDQPSWVALAKNVFDVMVDRWDTENCAGGLRWQVHPYQQGYNIKNAFTNGAFFQLSARLARYTSDGKYSKWADKIWDWSASTALLNTDDPKNWTIADSTSCVKDCKDASNFVWSYNYGAYISGAAYMYNVTDGDTKWKSRVDSLLKTTTANFFPESDSGKILVEKICEKTNNCNANNKLFKGILAEDLTFVSLVAPYTKSTILPLLQGSAAAAAQTCSGGPDGTLCSNRWYQKKFEGSGSLEEEIAAINVFTSNLVAFAHRNLATHLSA